MKITPNEAKKLLSKLQLDKNILLQSIARLATYVAAVSENAEDLRPEFSLEDTIEEIQKIDKKIITLKHGLNLFNNRMMLGPCGYTVAEALIKLPILNGELEDLKSMATAQPKTRIATLHTTEIEYKYINYSLDYAKKKFEQTRDEIASIQQWIDVIGATEMFEIDL